MFVAGEVLPGFHQRDVWEGSGNPPEGDHALLPQITLWYGFITARGVHSDLLYQRQKMQYPTHFCLT